MRVGLAALVFVESEIFVGAAGCFTDVIVGSRVIQSFATWLFDRARRLLRLPSIPP